MRLAAASALAALALAATPAQADEEASNAAFVAASEHGRCYARSTPTSAYGNEGETRIYRVEDKADHLVQTFDWYGPAIRVHCNVAGASGAAGISVVQFGPWPRGRTASDEVLALAFYLDGRLLRRYSTLDIAGRPDNVSASVSHYRVIDEILGYRWAGANRSVFAIRTVDGRELTFDAGDGTLVSSLASNDPVAAR